MPIPSRTGVVDPVEYAKAQLAAKDAEIARLEELGKLLRQNNKDVFVACEAEITRLREALKPFRGFWSDDEMKGLPDCHLFEMVWARADDGEDRINEETGKPYPAITAGQLRRARSAALKGKGERR